MKRPINICSGQFGDLTLEELCKTMHEIGYNGMKSPRRRIWMFAAC